MYTLCDESPISEVPKHTQVCVTCPDANAVHFLTGQNIYFHINHPINYVYLAGLVVEIEFYEWGTLLRLEDGSGASIAVKIDHINPGPKSGKRPQDQRPGTLVPRDHNSGSSSSSDDGDDHADLDRDVAPNLGPSKRTHLSTKTYATKLPNVFVTKAPADFTVSLDDKPLTIGTVLRAKGTLSEYRSALQVVLERAVRLRTLEDEVAVWESYTIFCSSVLSRPWRLSPSELQALEKSDHDSVAAKKARQREEETKRRRRGRKRQEWEHRKRRAEDLAEEERRKEAKELDGNPLDRPGWTPYLQEPEAERDPQLPRPVIHPRVQELGGRRRDGDVVRRKADGVRCRDDSLRRVSEQRVVGKQPERKRPGIKAQGRSERQTNS